MLVKMPKQMSERALYERRRRRAVISEAREHRVMTRWLKKMYPKISSEFVLFHTKLQKDNPHKRDLTTSDDFSRFIRLGDGMLCVSFPLSLFFLTVV